MHWISLDHHDPFIEILYVGPSTFAQQGLESVPAKLGNSVSRQFKANQCSGSMPCLKRYAPTFSISFWKQMRPFQICNFAVGPNAETTLRHGKTLQHCHFSKYHPGEASWTSGISAIIQPKKWIC